MENHLLQILYVITTKCPVCGYQAVDVSSRSDTDMVCCCCASVYDSKQKRLVIAELTAEEYHYGAYGHLDKRINVLFGTDDFVSIKWNDSEDEKGISRYLPFCPYCNHAMEKKKEMSLSEYVKEHKNIWLLYYNQEPKKLS